MTEQGAVPARGRRTLLPLPGGAGAPPGGNYDPPARSSLTARKRRKRGPAPE
jgi:hypothetical protein